MGLRHLHFTRELLIHRGNVSADDHEVNGTSYFHDSRWFRDSQQHLDREEHRRAKRAITLTKLPTIHDNEYFRRVVPSGSPFGL